MTIKKINLLRFYNVFLLMIFVFLFTACEKKIDNKPSLSEIFVTEDKITLINMEWGTLLEDAEGIIGELDKTKPEEIDAYTICQWPKEPLVIEEFDLVTHYIVYYFDVEDGFYQARLRIDTGDYDTTLEKFEELTEYFNSRFPKEIKQMKDGSANTYINMEDFTVIFRIAIEQFSDENYGIYLKVIKDLPYRSERYEESVRFSRDEIDAAKEVVQSYVDALNAEDIEAALSFIHEDMADNYTQKIKEDIEKDKEYYGEHIRFVRGIGYDGDRDIFKYEFKEENKIILRAVTYILMPEKRIPVSGWEFILVRDGKEEPWYIYEEGF